MPRPRTAGNLSVMARSFSATFPFKILLAGCIPLLGACGKSPPAASPAPTVTVVTVQPRERDKPALAAAVSQLAARENWKLLDLHAEEGRLDDVFRSITLPDTTKNRS